MNLSAKSLTSSLERRASGASHSRPVLRYKARSQRSDDLPPTGEEARIRRSETVMSLVWAGLGLFLVVLYSIALGVR